MTPGCFSVVPPIGCTCCMHYNRYKFTEIGLRIYFCNKRWLRFRMLAIELDL